MRKITSPADAGAPEAWVRLRAIRVLVDHRWISYGGVWRWHRHVIDLPSGAGQRVLDPSEVFWWALGFADGRRFGYQVKALQTEPVPDIIPLKALTDAYGENPHTAYSMWRRGKLYRLWLKARSMYVFRDQYVAQLSSWSLAKGYLPAANQSNVPALISRWLEIQSLIPALPEGVGENADLDDSVYRRPAIDFESRYERVRLALDAAKTAGWLAHLGPGQSDTVMVDVPISRDKAVTRTIPNTSIMAYVLGIGDSHGRGDIVTYQQPPKL